MALSYFPTIQLIDGNSTLGGQVEVDGVDDARYSDTLTAGANPTVSLEFAYANLLVFFALASVDMTITADGMSNPALTLKAGIPLLWNKDSGIPNPFVANVTEFVVANVAAGDLDIRALS